MRSSAASDVYQRQDDLFRHVNGAWLARAEIPADRPSTGSFTVLRDAAEEACRAILDELSAEIPADAGPPTTPRGKIAALYAAFMDAGRIEALGASPLEAELAPLLGATDKEALARAIGAGIATGFSGVIRVGVENDLNDPDHYTTWVGQAGLGLPDESYYREEAQADLRRDYVAHITRMMESAGLPARLGATAQELAERIMVLETDLAAGHWDRVTCRDIEKMNNPRTWDEIVSSAPGFPWETWREGVAAAASQAGAQMGSFLSRAIVEQPDYLPHAADVWRRAPLEDLRAWAAWHVVHGRPGPPVLLSPIPL